MTNRIRVGGSPLFGAAVLYAAMISGVAMAVISPSPADAGMCGTRDGRAGEPTSSDALAALRAAVDIPGLCALCPCDVDRDGKISTSDALRILERSVDKTTALSCADCTCIAQQRLDRDKRPRTVALADLDGDGALDVATASEFGNALEISFGEGGGAFSEHLTLDMDASPLSATVADIDGDGNPDLIATTLNPSTVRVYRGGGSARTFSPDPAQETTGGPINASVGDLNGDGRVDVAVSGSLANEVVFYLTTKRGFLREEGRHPVGVGPRWVELVDADADGKLDAVSANRDSGDLTFLFGDGEGGVAATVNQAVSAGPHQVVATDLEDDGTLDLIVPHKLGRGFSIVTDIDRRGAGEVTFQGSGIRNHNTPLWNAIADDFDGNGTVDVAFSAYSGTRQILLFLGDGEGGFAEPTTWLNGGLPRGLASGDVNGDGKIDLVSANTQSHDVAIQVGRGDGTFKELPVIGLRANLWSMDVADFNGDGIDDLVTANRFVGAYVYLGDGKGGSVGETTLKASHYPSDVETGDVDGDGDVDIVLHDNKSRNAQGKRVGDTHLGLFLNDGKGDFGDEIRIPDTHMDKLTEFVFAVGKIDDDDKADLVVIEPEGATARILRASGEGLFEPFGTFTTDGSWQAVLLKDLDGDQDLDLTFSGSGNDSGVRVHRNDGKGRFDAGQTLTLNDGARWIDAADLNNDGLAEIVASGRGGKNAAISVQRASGVFAKFAPYALGGTFSRARLSDVNGDGAADLVGLGFVQGGTGDVLMAAGDGKGGFGPPRGIARRVDGRDPHRGSPDRFVILSGDSDPAPDLFVSYRADQAVPGYLLSQIGNCLPPVTAQRRSSGP